MVMSIIRVLIGLVPVTIMAIDLLRLQFLGARLAVAAFFLNLILTSWSIGLIASGMVLKKGLGAEGLAWSMTFLLLPLCCVYYPVSTLPEWLQWISLALPPTHVFEGLRALVLENRFDAGAMLTALALNIVYFAAAATAFGLLLRSARWSGALLAVRRVTETTQLTIPSGILAHYRIRGCHAAVHRLSLQCGMSYSRCTTPRSPLRGRPFGVLLPAL